MTDLSDGGDAVPPVGRSSSPMTDLSDGEDAIPPVGGSSSSMPGKARRVGNGNRPVDHTDTPAVRNRQIAAVHAVTQVLFTKLGIDDRIRDALRLSMDAVEATAGSIYLYRETDDSLVFEYVVGPPNSAALLGQSLPSSEGIAGHVFRTGTTVIENDARRAALHRSDIGEAVGFVTHNMVTAPLKTLDGEPVGVMQILNKRRGDFDHDDVEVLEIVAAITATAIENANLQREAQVAAVARAVGDLSHDIKNKVAPISMVAHLLRPDLDSMFESIDRLSAGWPEPVPAELRQAVATVRSEYEEHCDIILQQVAAVQEHTKRISDVLKGTVTEPQIELIEAQPLIDEQTRLLEPVARNNKIILSSRVDGTPTLVPLDRFFLCSAVYNLINNAIPETPPGGSVTVTTRYVPEGDFPDGNYVEISVSDTGRGMPAQMLDRILRGDATSTKVGGTGLGTRIVYNAVRAHRGVFLGSSELGRGTTFAIKLPLTRPGK